MALEDAFGIPTQEFLDTDPERLMTAGQNPASFPEPQVPASEAPTDIIWPGRTPKTQRSVTGNDAVWPPRKPEQAAVPDDIVWPGQEPQTPQASSVPDDIAWPDQPQPISSKGGIGSDYAASQSPPPAPAEAEPSMLDRAKPWLGAAKNALEWIDPMAAPRAAGQMIGGKLADFGQKAYEDFKTATPAEKAKPPTDETPNQMLEGFQSGFPQLKKLTGSAIEGLGHIIEHQPTVDLGKEWSKAGDEGQKEHAPRVAGFRNVRTDSVANFVQDVASLAGYQSAQGVVSSLPSLAGGGAIGLLTRNPRLSVALGSAPASFIQNYGDVYSSTKEDDDIAKRITRGEISEKQVASLAIAPGLVMAALDVWGLDNILGKELAKEAKQDLLKRIVKGISSGAVVEGSTEGLQEIISQWFQAKMGSQKGAWETFSQVLDNVLGGAFMGGPMKGVTSAVPAHQPSGGVTAGANPTVPPPPPGLNPGAPPGTPGTPGTAGVSPPSPPPPGAQNGAPIIAANGESEAPTDAVSPLDWIASENAAREERAKQLGQAPQGPTEEDDLSDIFDAAVKGHFPGTSTKPAEEKGGFVDAGTVPPTGQAEGGKGGEAWTAADDTYAKAVDLVRADGRASTSYIQRKLGLGYVAASALMDRMEKEGVVSAANHAGKRDVLPAVPASAEGGTREAPVEIKSPEDIEAAAAVANQEHSGAQGEANNIQRGHADWHGLGVTIEAPAGGIRRGTTPEGKEWTQSFTHAYGDIKGTLGADKMKIDAYLLGEKPQVYVMDELDPKTGAFRQHKTFLGAEDSNHAREAYLGTQGKSAKMWGGGQMLTADEFKEWLKSDTTKPIHKGHRADQNSREVQNRTLRAYGYTQFQIDRMSPKQRAAEWEDAVAAGVKPEDAEEPSTVGAGNRALEPENSPPVREVLPTKEHSAAIDAAIRNVGEDPAKVDQESKNEAARIHAQEGASPEQAFMASVVRALIADGHLDEDVARKELGDEAETVLGTGSIAGHVASSQAPGATARGAATAQQGPSSPGSNQDGAQPSRQVANEGTGGATHGAERETATASGATNRGRGLDAGAENAGSLEAAETWPGDQGAHGRRPAGVERTKSGEEQLVIPGTERISAAEHAARLAEAPKRAKRKTPQRIVPLKKDVVATPPKTVEDTPFRVPASKLKQATALQYLASRGGLKPSAELKKIGITYKTGLVYVPGKGRRNIVVKSGATLDEAHERLIDGNYLSRETWGKNMHAQILDMFDEEHNRKRPTYPMGQDTGERTQHERTTANEELSGYEDEVRAMLDETGMTPHVTDAAHYIRRAATIIANEGLSADNAWVLAVMREDIDDGVVTAAEIGDILDLGDLDGIYPTAAHETVAAPAQKIAVGAESGAQGAGAVERDGVPGRRENDAEARPGPTEEVGADNKPQLVIPGAEKASEKTLAQRKADEKLKPKAEQKAADEGLFGDGHKQGDLLDLAAKPPPEPKAPPVDIKVNTPETPTKAPETGRSEAVSAISVDEASKKLLAAEVDRDKLQQDYDRRMAALDKVVTPNNALHKENLEKARKRDENFARLVLVKLRKAEDAVDDARKALAEAKKARAPAPTPEPEAKKPAKPVPADLDEIPGFLKRPKEGAKAGSPSINENAAEIKEPGNAESAANKGGPDGPTIQGRPSYISAEAALADVEAGKIKQADDKAGWCYKLAANAVIENGGFYVIGVTGTKVRPIYHGVVEDLHNHDVFYRDPTLTFDGWFEKSVFDKVVSGFHKVHSMSGGEAKGFGLRNGKYPDPVTLKLPTLAELKKSGAFEESKRNAQFADTEKWWKEELTPFGREQVVESLNLKKAIAKTGWQHMPLKVQEQLAGVRGTDRDPLMHAEAPTWAQVMAALPKDEKGRPDIKRAADIFLSVAKKSKFNDLTPSEKTEVLRRLQAEKPAAPQQTGAEEWWNHHLTEYGRRQVGEAAGVPERHKKMKWHNIDPMLQAKLLAIRNTDKDPAKGTVTAPEGYVFDEDTLRQVKNDRNNTIANMNGGDWSIVVRRLSPWSAEKGYGWTPDEARRDALRRVGAIPSAEKPAEVASAPSAENVSRAPDDVSRESLKADDGLGDIFDAAVSEQFKKPEPEKKPRGARPKMTPEAPPKTWTEIGKNENGRTLYEDDRGVRSYVEDGVRITEPVGMRPTRGGVEIIIDRTGKPEWQVTEPAKDLEGATPDNAKPEHPGLVIKSLETGKETHIQPPGTVPPKESGTKADHELAELQAKLPAGYTASRMDSRMAPFRVEGPNHFGIESDAKTVIAEAKKHARSAPPRGATQAGKSAAKNIGMGLADVARGLDALFNPKGKLSGLAGGIPTFDSETYEKAKPFFKAGVAHFAQAAQDIGEMVRQLVGYLVKTAKMDEATVNAMKPYVLQFVRDVRDGKESLDVDRGSEQTGAMGKNGVGETGADLADGKPAGNERPGDVGDQPADNAGGTAEATGGEGTGPRPGGSVSQGGTGIHKGGNAANGRPRAGGKRVATPGVGGRPEHASLRPNYHIADPERLVGGGPKARFARNKAAIEAFRAITDEGRDPTAEELDAMAGYMGWGSFGQELFQGNWERPRPKEGWEAEDKWLREHLGKTEWEGAQSSIINAHYTDPPTVKAMWDMARAMGFKGGRVLEPSMGIGNFFGLMPREVMSESQLTGIELDPLTGGMAKLLYPHANIQIKPYQDSKTGDNFYDLVIGNWPFAAQAPADRRYSHLNATLHDFFFVKALDQVRPGGIVMGITSSGTMDKIGKPVRIHLAKNAELVASFRLPSGAFEKYAGTAVVTDIIILKKREKPILEIADAGWIESRDKDVKGGTIRTNEYWDTHPDNVLGTLAFGHGTTRGREGMIVDREADFPQKLAALPTKVPEGAYAPVQRGSEPRFVTNDTKDRQSSIVSKGGKLYQVQGERLALLEDVVRYKTANKAETAKREHQIATLAEMRKLYDALLASERAGSDTTEADRTNLRDYYKRFVATHGPIVDSDGISIMKRAGDPGTTILLALETPQGKPARILTESTTRSKKTLEKPSVREAFVLQRNESTTIDMAKIAQAAGVTEEDAADELQDGNAIYRTPGGGFEVSDIYLSGNVRRKLREAIDAKEGGETDLDKSIAALQKVIPPDVPYYKIEAKLGAPWVPNEDYVSFIAGLLGVQPSDDIAVSFTAGRWKVRFQDRSLNHRPEANTQWGSMEHHFDKILTAAMGNVSITIQKKDQDGNTYVDEAASREVNEKAARLREEFSAWVWRDVSRKVRLERAYNDVMRAIATPKFDGSFLDFSGMALRKGNDPFSLRQHQVNAIWRGIVNRSGLYAHEVGTGKTFTMGGIAVESRRYGIARKPLLLAHNANSASVAAEIQEMYPGAKVLYVDNLTPATIEVTMRRIANDDWDVIVVPHSVIDRFALSEETLNAMMAEDIAALEQEAIEAAQEDGAHLSVEDMDSEEDLRKVRSPTAKQLVKQRNQIKEKIKQMAQRASREGAIKFEDLGVDMIMVDEVHEFKKPPITTKMRMRGLNTGTSDRSIALRFLTDYVKSINGGRGVHVFTGTPITNTLAEIYNMQRYVMSDVMSVDEIKDWDSWFNTFADSSTDVELTATGEYEAVTRLASFVNVADLRQMIGQYMDIVFADDMPEFKPRAINGKTMASADLTPLERDELVNGRTENAIGRPYKKVVNDIGPMSPEQQGVLEHLAQLAKDFRDDTKKGRRERMLSGHPSSPILVETAAANAGLDARLFDMGMPDHPQNKVNRTVKNVLGHYRESDQATQVIFVDRGYGDSTTRTAGRNAAGDKVKVKVPRFNLVQSIVDKLVDGGIPRHQIEIVDGKVSKGRRKEIADKMNTAEVRVVIGNSDTLGVGVNMQRNLRAMHHMDAPWMPGELEQRNGRGWRQGNQWNTVLEYRYITEKLDGRRWQVLAVKDRFIKSFLTADEDVRVIEGDAVSMDEGESVADLMSTLSAAAGDPRLLVKNKLESDIRRLQARERQHAYGIEDANAEVGRIERRIKSRMGEAENLTKYAEAVTAARGNGDTFSAVVKGKEFTERKAAGVALDDAVKKLAKGESVVIAKVYGFPVEAEWSLFKSEPDYRIVTPTGYWPVRPSLASIEAVLRNFAKKAQEAFAEVEDMRGSKDRMEAAAKEPFAQAKTLEDKSEQLRALMADMDRSPAIAPSWLRQGTPIDTKVWVRDGEALTARVVQGHRWGESDYYVGTDKGDVPYLDALDENGMRIYDPRPFQPPVAKQTNAPIPNGAPSGAVSASNAPLGGTSGSSKVEGETATSNLTPAAEQRGREIADIITRFIHHITGKGVRIEFVPGRGLQIANPDGGWGAYVEGRDILGAYSNTVERIISLALDNPGIVTTAAHEAYHDVEAILQDRNEHALMTSPREMERLRKIVQKIRGFTDEELAGIAGYEIRAMAFEAYVASRINGGSGSETGLHIGFRRFFEKVMRFLRALRNALQGMGFRTAEDIFAKAYEGGYAKQAPLRAFDANGMEAPLGATSGAAAIGPRRAAHGPLHSPHPAPPRPPGGPRVVSPGTAPLPVPQLQPLHATVRAALNDPTLSARERYSAAFDALMLPGARALWDKLIDLSRLQRAAELMTGNPVPERLDTHLAAQLYMGRTPERLKDAEFNLFFPIYDAMREHGVGREELHDYLYARHAFERNAQIRTIDPTNDSGSGMTDAEAQTIIDDIDNSRRRADFDAVAALVDAVVTHNRDLMERAGLEHASTLMRWQNAYQHYVPLKGAELNDDDYPPTPSRGMGFSVRGPESRRALGRFDRAGDILANIIDQTQRTIVRAEKNKVVNTFARFAMAHPSPLYRLGLAETRRRVNPTTGLVETVWVTTSADADNVLPYKVAGDTHYIRFDRSAEGLLLALKNLGMDRLPGLFEAVRSFTRAYSTFQTAKDPQFVLTNLVRDIQDAGIAMTAEQQRGFVTAYFKNLTNGRSFLAAVLGQAGATGNRYGQLYEEWRADGGKVSSFGWRNIESIIRDIRKELGYRTESMTRKVAMQPIRTIDPFNGHIVRLFEALSDVTESTTRLAVYAAAREVGMTRAQAALAARVMTVDFSAKGSYGHWLQAFYAFSGPQIQGTVSLGRRLRKSAAFRRAMMGVAGAGFLLTLWNNFASPPDDDDDKKNVYEQLKYWERQKNIIVYLPGNKEPALTIPLGGKIPLGYMLMPFWMMGENAAMATLGKVKPLTALWNWIGSAAQSFNPLGAEGSALELPYWLKTLSPTALDPIVELVRNRDWLDRPIHPDEMPWTRGEPHSEQSKIGTSPFAESAAQWLNRITGGNHFQKGAVDKYPDDIEYVWNFAFGGYGRFMSNSFGMIKNTIDGVDTPVEKIPFVQRFAAPGNREQIDRSDYYDKRNQVKEQVDAVRRADQQRRLGNNVDDANKTIDELGPKIGFRRGERGGVSSKLENEFKASDKKLKTLREEERNLRRDTGISRAERSSRLKENRAKQLEEMRGPRKSYREYQPSM